MSNYEYLLNAYNKKHSQVYNNTLNSYSRYINSYNNFVSPYNSPNINKNIVESFKDALYENHSQNYGSSYIPENRSLWNRFVDILNVGQYASAGFVKGFVDDKITPFEGAVQGLRAGNFLGSGHTKWEYSYDDVLRDMGWDVEENPDGKWYNPFTWNPKNVARNVVSFSGDVLLDPFTYVSGGIGSLIKGTGKETVKQSLKVADVLGDTSKYADEVIDIAKGLRMTDDIAEKIIVNSKVYKSGLFDLDLVDEVKKLSKSYNKLIGINDSVDDVVLSLANAPLGKKIFGHYADKSIKLIDSDTMKKIGDKTLAPGYARLRDSVLGGRLGKMFSTNHTLYKLSKTNPEQVYSSLKAVEMKAGLTKGKLTQKDLININADFFKNLTPAENKEVIEVLQDKSKWNKIQKTFRYADSDDAEKLRKRIEAERQELYNKVDNIKKNKEYNSKILDNIYDDIELKNKALDALESQRVKAINSINLDSAYRKGLLNDVEIQTVDATKDLIEETKGAINIKPSINKYRNYLKQSKVGNVELELRDKLIDTFSKDYIEAFVKSENLSNPQIDVLEAVDNYLKLENPFDGLTNTTKKRYIKQVKDNGYIRFSKSKKSNAEDALSKLKGWQSVTYGNGDIGLFPPKDVVKSVDFSNLDDEVYSFLGKNFVNKEEIVNDLSNYIFGKSGMINRKVQDNSLEKLFKMIERDASIHELADEVFRNKKLYNGASAEMYSFISSQLGYNSWEEFYTKPIKELLDIELSGKKLTHDQELLKVKLLKADMNREYLKSLFKDVDSYDETVKLRRELKDAEITRDIDEIFEDILDREVKRGRSISELKRDDFNINDYMTKVKDGIASKRNEIRIKTDDFSIGTHHKDEIADVLIDKFRLYNDDGYKNLSDANNKKLNILQSDLESINKKIDDINNKISITTKKLNETPNPQLSKALDKQKRYYNYFSEKKSKTLQGIENAKKYDPMKDNKGFMRMVDDVSVEMEKMLRYRNLEYGQLDLQDRLDLINDAYTQTNKISSAKAGEPAQKEFYDKLDKTIKEAQKKKQKALERAHDKYIETVKRNDVIKFESEGSVIKGVVNKVDDVDGKRVFTIEDESGKLHDVLSNNFKGRVGSVQPRNLDDIRDMDDLYNNFVIRQTELYDKFEELKNTPKNFSKIIKTPIESDLYAKSVKNVENTIKLYDDEVNKIKNTIEELEIKIDTGSKKLNMFTLDEEKFIKKIDEMEDAINNVDSFEIYVRTHYNIDVDSYIKEIPSKFILDPDLDISPNSRNAVNILREEFLKMGKDELGLGYLTQEQFEAMAYEYLPHIATPEGKEFFSRNKDIKKYIKGFGDDFGYGREFDPYSRSRKLKNLIIDGKLVENPTIEQINEFFSKQLKGKNVFSENVADIYLARAIKHNDLIYDNKYMENMLEIFGEDLDKELGEGFSTVINYGMLKRYSSDVVQKTVSLDISDAISLRLEEEDVIRKLSNEIGYRLKEDGNLGVRDYNKKFKKLLDEEISLYIEKYMKEELTDDIRKKMYTGALEKFLNNTGTSGMLDDVALPLTELNGDHIQRLNNSTDMLKARYEGHIRDKFGSLVRVKDKKRLKELSIDFIEKELNKILSTSDDIDSTRVQRIIDRIDEYKGLSYPQIKQMNTDFIEKANMTRKLQIQRDNNNLLSLYDKFTHFIKLNQTTVLPTFHLRNLYSNQFNNWLEIGSDAVNPSFRKKTLDVIRGNIDSDDVLEIIGDGGSVTKIKWKDVLRKAEEYGVLDEGMFAKELGAMSGTDGALGKFLPKHLDPTDTKNFFAYKKGSEIGSLIEGHDRFIHFASQIKRGMNFSDASKSVNEFLFDYSDLTFFEMSVMKRVMPYYTWLRKNSQLQLTQLLNQPDKYRMISKVVGGIENMVYEEDRMDDRFVSEFAKDWVQLPISMINERGVSEAVILNPNLPYMDINRIPDPTNLKDSMRELFTQTNPLIKLPIEIGMNKNLFFDSPIAKEDESRIGKSVEHGFNQLGAVPQLRGFFNKSGADLGMHTLKNLTGITTLGYDYKAHRGMKMDEINKKRDSINRRLGR